MNITEIEELKEKIEAACGNHAKIYLAICFGMVNYQSTPSALSVALGKSEAWAQLFRYVADLTSYSFSALYHKAICPQTAKVLSEFVDSDQNEYLRKIMAKQMTKREARKFLEDQLAIPGRVVRVRNRIYGPWPKPKLVTLEVVLSEDNDSSGLEAIRRQSSDGANDGGTQSDVKWTPFLEHHPCS